MKKYFVFFSNAEAFLKFQYICQSIKRSSNNNNIVVGDFIGKELNIVYLKKGEANLTIKQLKQISLNCDEFLIINFKNKPTIDIEYLDFFELIENKSYKYLENKIHSCNHNRLSINIKSLLENISSDVAIRDLSAEIKIAKEKRDILDYFNSVISYSKIETNQKTIYDMLYLVYCVNNTSSFETKSVFVLKTEQELENHLKHYKSTLNTLIHLYQEGIVSYPFDEECDVIKENEILKEEKKIVALLKEELSSVAINDKNSIYLGDIAYIYHIEYEENTPENFIKIINFCIEKNIFYYYEGKIYMTKNGEKLYNSIIDRNLENYLLKGF